MCYSCTVHIDTHSHKHAATHSRTHAQKSAHPHTCTHTYIRYKQKVLNYLKTTNLYPAIEIINFYSQFDPLAQVQQAGAAPGGADARRRGRGLGRGRSPGAAVLVPQHRAARRAQLPAPRPHALRLPRARPRPRQPQLVARPARICNTVVLILPGAPIFEPTDHRPSDAETSQQAAALVALSECGDHHSWVLRVLSIRQSGHFGRLICTLLFGKCVHRYSHS